MKKSLIIISSISLITLISKFFGVSRDLVLSFFYGTTSISDAYLLATTLPVTLFGIIYDGISASFIPVCSRIQTQESRNKFTNNIINALILITLAAIIIIEIIPSTIIKIFASGFDSETMSSAVEILRISIIGVIFSAVTCILVSYLNFNKKFILASARAIPMDIVVIASIAFAFYANSTAILAIGIPISLFVAMVFLLPDIKKLNFKYSLVINFKDENLRSLLKWSMPVVLSTALLDVNSIVDRQFASYLLVGGISVITYSSRLLNIVSSLVFLPVMSYLFPSLSQKVSANEIDYVKSLTNQILRYMIILSTPICALIFLESQEIVEIVFHRGSFGTESVIQTSNCLKFYSLSVVALGISAVTTKVFYSYADMWTPMKISAVGVMLNIVFNFVFTRYFGLQGLPLASSLSLTFVAFWQVFLIYKKLKINYMEQLKLFVKVILCALVALTITLLSNSFLVGIPVVLSLLIVSIIFVITYFAMLLVFRINELFNILKYFKLK